MPNFNGQLVTLIGRPVPFNLTAAGRVQARSSATRRGGRAASRRSSRRAAGTTASRRAAGRPGGGLLGLLVSMSTGLPAASASSCAWHVRSIVMNHHAASSTDVCPTVSRPWLRQDGGLVVAERVGDALALLEVEHDAGVVVEHGVVAVERARVLRQRIERAPQRRPALAVDRVGVRRGDDVGAGGVHLAVDHERRRVHRPVALDDLAVVVDEDEVLHPDLLEVHGERVDPEVVEQLGIAGRDVAGDALVEAELAEQAERRGQPLLAMPALVLGLVNWGNAWERAIRRHGIGLGTTHIRSGFDRQTTMSGSGDGDNVSAARRRR